MSPPALALLVATALSTWSPRSARAFPFGYSLDEQLALHHDGLVGIDGRGWPPLRIAQSGWVLVGINGQMMSESGIDFVCRRAAPVGQVPPSADGPGISGPLYEPLGRPRYLIGAAPGVPLEPGYALLRVNPPYTNTWTHGLARFDCERGETGRWGLRLPDAIMGRPVVLEGDVGGPEAFRTRPFMLLGPDGNLYARMTETPTGADPDFPWATFNHLVRWPVESDASAPERVLSSRDFVDAMMTGPERAEFRRMLGWSLRITAYLPMPDGSLWFILDLNNDRGLRDPVPTTRLYRRAPDGSLALLHAAVSPPDTSAPGNAASSLMTGLLPTLDDASELIVGRYGVIATRAPFPMVTTLPIDTRAASSIAGPGGAWVFARLGSDPLGPGFYAPVRVPPELDRDGDLLPRALEAQLGTDDFRIDTDGDGLHDRAEHLDPLEDPITPSTTFEPEPVPLRWGLSTRIQSAPFAKPDRSAWTSTPWFDGHRPDGHPTGALGRNTAEGSPTTLPTTAWALSNALGVGAQGWHFEGSVYAFLGAPMPWAPPPFDGEITTGIRYLGPDEAHEAALVTIAHPYRFPIFRLYPDNTLEFLFDPTWYGLPGVEQLWSLERDGVYLARFSDSDLSRWPRPFAVLGADFVPHPIDLSLSWTAEIVRPFDVGYGVADNLEPFVGGYATHWIAELTVDDDRLRAGDLLAAAAPIVLSGRQDRGIGGLFVVREDLSVARWLAPRSWFELATGRARTWLEAAWAPYLKPSANAVPPMPYFSSLAFAPDARRLCLVEEGRVWELELDANGRALAVTLPVEAGALGCDYADGELALLFQTGDLARVQRPDGQVLAEIPLRHADDKPWKLLRLGHAEAPTWAILVEGGGARCARPSASFVDGVRAAVVSPASANAVIWMDETRVLASELEPFCQGVAQEIVDVWDPQPKSFWDDVARGVIRRAGSGPDGCVPGLPCPDTGVLDIETLTALTAELAVRPDGMVLAGVRTYKPGGYERLLPSALGGLTTFRGAFRPVTGQGSGAHGLWRRPRAGPRFGVPLTNTPFFFGVPMARVPGEIPSDWGRVPWTEPNYPEPTPPTPTDSPPPDPTPPPAPPKADDEGCGASSRPLALEALALLSIFKILDFHRRRRNAT